MTVSYPIKKVLVIDDDASLHDLCRAILSRFGYICLSAFNGQDGLDIIVEESPDLVLLDLMMPGIDGQQVYEKLISESDYQSHKHTPVIMLTAVAGDEERKNELLSKGVSAYLNKPFGLNELVNIIQSVLVTHEVKLRNIHLQEEISNAKQYLERIIDHAPLGIVVIDHYGVISRLNTFFAKLIGVEHPKELIGNNLLESGLINRIEIQNHFNRSIREGIPSSIPTIDIQNLYGQNRKVNIQCVPLRDESGNIISLLSIWEDVTEITKRAYQLTVLRQISEAVQSVLDIDILLHMILTSITAGCALGFSRAMIFMVNEEANLLEGRMGVGPISAEAANQIWRNLAQDHTNLDDFLAKFGYKQPDYNDPFNKEAIQLRISLDKKDDILVHSVLTRQSFWIRGQQDLVERGFSLTDEMFQFFQPQEFVTVPMFAKNRVIAIIVADNKYSSVPLLEDQVSLLKLLANHAGLALENAEAYRKLEDKVQQLAETVTELEDTQDKLVRSEQLAIIGRMAAHVAHEIRNPLTAIGGFAKTILKNPRSEENVKLGAQIIDREVQRLEKILRNVLNFTRISQPFKRKNNINQVIREVVALQQPVIKENISIKVELNDNIPDFYFDDDQIKQAIMNVLANSISSIEDMGEIKLRTDYTEDEVYIEIADTGIGMPKDMLDNIFNPFYTTRQDGTGLGLAVTQRIVEGHDGKIKVDSEVNKGTTFRLILPLVTEIADVPVMEEQNKQLER